MTAVIEYLAKIDQVELSGCRCLHHVLCVDQRHNCIAGFFPTPELAHCAEKFLATGQDLDRLRCYRGKNPDQQIMCIACKNHCPGVG